MCAMPQLSRTMVTSSGCTAARLAEANANEQVSVKTLNRIADPRPARSQPAALTA